MNELPIHAEVVTNSLGYRARGTTAPVLPVRRVTIERASEGSGVILRYWSKGGAELQRQTLPDLSQAKRIAEQECELRQSSWKRGAG